MDKTMARIQMRVPLPCKNDSRQHKKLLFAKKKHDDNDVDRNLFYRNKRSTKLEHRNITVTVYAAFFILGLERKIK